MRTPQETAVIRARLEVLVAELEAAAKERASTEGSITPDNAIGRLTRMEALQARAMHEAGQRRQAERLPKVRRAIDRLEQGNYGRCVRCGETIPEGRLELMPETAFSVRCAARR